MKRLPLSALAFQRRAAPSSLFLSAYPAWLGGCGALAAGCTAAGGHTPTAEGGFNSPSRKTEPNPGAVPPLVFIDRSRKLEGSDPPSYRKAHKTIPQSPFKLRPQISRLDVSNTPGFIYT